MANAYANTLDLMDRLGIPHGDSREGALTDLLEAASRWIDRITGHRFYAVSETRYYTPCSSTDLRIDDVLSITSLTSDANGDGVYDTTWTAVTDYWLGPRNAVVNGQPYTTIHRTQLTGRYYFPGFPDGVRVTGSFGYSTLATRPSNIRELCLIVATMNARPLLDLTIEGAQMYKLGQELTVTMAPDQLPDRGKKLLDLYRDMALVV